MRKNIDNFEVKIGNKEHGGKPEYYKKNVVDAMRMCCVKK